MKNTTQSFYTRKVEATLLTDSAAIKAAAEKGTRKTLQVPTPDNPVAEGMKTKNSFLTKNTDITSKTMMLLDIISKINVDGFYPDKANKKKTNRPIHSSRISQSCSYSDDVETYKIKTNNNKFINKNKLSRDDVFNNDDILPNKKVMNTELNGDKKEKVFQKKYYVVNLNENLTIENPTKKSNLQANNEKLTKHPLKQKIFKKLLLTKTNANKKVMNTELNGDKKEKVFQKKYYVVNLNENVTIENPTKKSNLQANNEKLTKHPHKQKIFEKLLLTKTNVSDTFQKYAYNTIQ